MATTVPWTPSDDDQHRAEVFGDEITAFDNEELLDVLLTEELNGQNLGSWQIAIVRREILDRMAT